MGGALHFLALIVFFMCYSVTMAEINRQKNNIGYNAGQFDTPNYLHFGNNAGRVNTRNNSGTYAYTFGAVAAHARYKIHFNPDQGFYEKLPASKEQLLILLLISFMFSALILTTIKEFIWG